MSVTSIASSGGNQAAPLDANYDPLLQDFHNLSSTIQAGDISGAQKSFSMFLQDSRAALPSSGLTTGPNDPLGTDINNLLTALQAGDATNAEKAVSAFLQDIQGTLQAHHDKHHEVCQACSVGQAQGGDAVGNYPVGSTTC